MIGFPTDIWTRSLTILLITAYLLFAILVAIFFDAYAHLKMFKPLELFGILHIQLWAKS